MRIAPEKRRDRFSLLGPDHGGERCRCGACERSKVGKARADCGIGRPELLATVGEAGGIGECTRSEEHTSELQSLMRISYAVFWLKKKIELMQQGQAVNT